MSSGKLEEFITNTKIVISTIKKSILDFERIFTIYFLILLVCLIVFVLIQIIPGSDIFLSAASATPWGIVTAIFTHTDIVQLAFNMGGLFLFLLLFAFCNSTFHPQSKRKIEMFFLVSIFVFSIISNVLWIAFKPKPSSGASGLLYAVEGTLLGFSIANGWQLLNFSRVKARISTAVNILMNVFVSGSFLVQIVLNPGIFLNAGVGLNVIAHGYSFLFGFLVSVPWYYIFGKLTVLE
jgi:membrane associated rhomboid family serine protease